MKCYGTTKTFPTPCNKPYLQANFTFVARSPHTGKAATINPLAPVTDGDKALWEEGERKAAARKARYVAASAGASDSAEQLEVHASGLWVVCRPEVGWALNRFEFMCPTSHA
jgi:hypothetical protein